MSGARDRSAPRRPIAYDPCASSQPDAPDGREELDDEERELLFPEGWDAATVQRYEAELDSEVGARWLRTGTSRSASGLDPRLLAPARRLPPPSAPALVFAYGSNLLPAQMASRVPGSAPVSSALLSHHRLDFVGWSDAWGGGVATVSPRDVSCGGESKVPPAPSQVPKVHGLVWKLPEGGLDRLDSYEGNTRVYERSRLVVELPTGTVLAWCYRHRNPILAAPSRAYVATILAGAREFKLPTAHVRIAAKRAQSLKGQLVLG